MGAEPTPVQHKTPPSRWVSMIQDLSPLFPTRTPTLMAALLSLRCFHSIAVGNSKANGAFVANEALLEIADKLDTPRRIVK